jgi:hypothetical protein
MSKFYVYAYLRSKDSVLGKSGTPYYIGKGSGNRSHVKHHTSMPTDHNNIIFIKTGLSEQQALDLEIELINHYERKDLNTGILHNRTNGGEGISNPSFETREKMSHAKRNESPETRLKRSIAAKNRIRTSLSEETKKRISEANKGRKRTNSSKEKMSNCKKGQVLSEEHKNKISKALKGISKAPFSDEHKVNISKSRQGKPWSTARRAAQQNKEK